MKTVTNYFEIKTPEDSHGLNGRYATEDAALAAINWSCKNALESGYDNKHEKWIIVCVESIVERCEDNTFIRETITRSIVRTCEYSEVFKTYVLA